MVTQVVKPQRKKRRKNSLRPNIRYPLPVWGLCEDFSIETYQNRGGKKSFLLDCKTNNEPEHHLYNTILWLESGFGSFFPLPIFFSRCLAHCDFSARHHQTTTAAGSRMPLSLDLPLLSSLCCRCCLCDSRAAKAKPNKSQISPLVKNAALPAPLSHSLTRSPPPNPLKAGEPR